MASAEHEPITGVWGQSPQRGPGAEPLVKGQVAKPPEAESILVIGCPTEPANLAPFQKCICISTLGATVMIWENLFRNPGGQVTPLAPSWGAHANSPPVEHALTDWLSSPTIAG